MLQISPATVVEVVGWNAGIADVFPQRSAAAYTAAAPVPQKGPACATKPLAENDGDQIDPEDAGPTATAAQPPRSGTPPGPGH